MEITPPKTKGFIFCSCYRPPNVDNEAAYVEGLRNMWTVVADREKEIVITGDLNFDLKQSNKPASTKRFINMRQIIDNFTRITEHSKTLIDFFSPDLYSRLPIIRTFKGNRKKFELSGVRVMEGKII